MKPRTMIITVLALIFGGASAVGVWFFLHEKSELSRVDLVSVVMTAIDIPRGEKITAEELTIREYPKAMVPEGALTKLEQAVDRTVAIQLIKGEPVLDAKLSSKSAGRGLASLIPKGMRAMTIQTPNVATGVAGLLIPGDKVDVLMTTMDTGSESAQSGGGSSTILLQRVEILAVDQRVNGPVENTKPDTKEMRSVTLLVTPQEASKLDLGQNRGILRLSLRNPADESASEVQPFMMSDIKLHRERVLAPAPVAVAAKPPSPPAQPPMMRIRTIRGSNEGSVLVQPSSAPGPEGLARKPRQ